MIGIARWQNLNWARWIMSHSEESISQLKKRNIHPEDIELAKKIIRKEEETAMVDFLKGFIRKDIELYEFISYLEFRQLHPDSRPNLIGFYTTYWYMQLLDNKDIKQINIANISSISVANLILEEAPKQKVKKIFGSTTSAIKAISGVETVLHFFDEQEYDQVPYPFSSINEEESFFDNWSRLLYLGFNLTLTASVKLKFSLEQHENAINRKIKNPMHPYDMVNKCKFHGAKIPKFIPKVLSKDLKKILVKTCEELSELKNEFCMNSKDWEFHRELYPMDWIILKREIEGWRQRYYRSPLWENMDIFQFEESKDSIRKTDAAKRRRETAKRRVSDSSTSDLTYSNYDLKCIYKNAWDTILSDHDYYNSNR